MMKKAYAPPYRMLLAMIVTLCLAVSLGYQATALSPEEMVGEPVPYYIGTLGTSASLSISSSGEASCWGYLDCYRGYTADAAMRLQWLNSEGIWIDYHSWYGEGRAVDFDETWNVPKGRTYRVRVIGDVFDEDGNWVEMVDAVSGSVKY